MPIPVSSAIAAARKPEPELVSDVVREALNRCGTPIAQSVLLFLSEDFARQAPAAVHAASRTANCLQVAGCTAPGVFNQEDWVLDRPAACALVFGGGIGLSPPGEHPGAPVITLATPQAATAHWLNSVQRRLGLLSTDGSGLNAGRVWGHGKVSPEGRFEAVLTGTRSVVGASLGLRILTAPAAVSEVDGYEIAFLGEQPALDSLLRELPPEMREQQRFPLHLLAAGVISGDPTRAIEDRRYTLVPLITVNHEERRVTLATRLETGTHVFWALRSAVAAERDMRALVDTLAADLGNPPDFALMFSCMGRGPYFFGGEERDLAVVRERFPSIPLAGAYGSGEIGCLSEGNRILHNAAVLGLFTADV